jgi:hypothetical protein
MIIITKMVLYALWSVTTDGVWMDERIYWTLSYSAWLHFTVHTHTHTLVPTVTSPPPLLGSDFRRRAFPFLWVPELCPASPSNSNSSQQLSPSSPLTNSLTHQPTDCNSQRQSQSYFTTGDCWLARLITSRHGSRRKHRSSVAVKLGWPRDRYWAIAYQRPLFSEPLLNSCCCTLVYFTVVV